MTHSFADIVHFNGKIILVKDMNDNNLKFCREELEMTQSELGLVFGVTGSTVSGWENAHDTMPLPKLVKFSNLYHSRFSSDISSTDKSIICVNFILEFNTQSNTTLSISSSL